MSTEAKTNAECDCCDGGGVAYWEDSVGGSWELGCPGCGPYISGYDGKLHNTPTGPGDLVALVPTILEVNMVVK